MKNCRCLGWIRIYGWILSSFFDVKFPQVVPFKNGGFKEESGSPNLTPITWKPTMGREHLKSLFPLNAWNLEFELLADVASHVASWICRRDRSKILYTIWFCFFLKCSQILGMWHLSLNEFCSIRYWTDVTLSKCWAPEICKLATQPLTPPRKPGIIEEYLESFMSTNWGGVSLKQTLGGGVKILYFHPYLGKWMIQFD